MKKLIKKLKPAPVRWKQFSRRGDAIFRSLGKEIIIATLSVATLTFALPHNARAQQPTYPISGEEEESDTLQEVVVSATKLPMTLGTTARIVQCLTLSQNETSAAPCLTINDLLKRSPSLDVRQRGAFGIQTDISINGGTHDQILILVDGINISSPQTGHLTTDFPFTKDDIDHIEILEGAASRIYGTSAFTGAINIITKKYGKVDSHRLNANIQLNVGSFGTTDVETGISLQGKQSFNRLSASYTRSDGGTLNSSFNKTNAFYHGGWKNDQMSVCWNIGAAIRNFGANTFYSGKYPNQFEQTRKFSGNVSFQTNGIVNLKPVIYGSRSFDHYQLEKNATGGENYHQVDVFGTSLTATTNWCLGTTLLGTDIRNEGVLSTNLGKPLDENEYVNICGSNRKYTNKDNRTNVTCFVEHDLVLDKWTFSMGMMANMNTAIDHRYRFCPGIDVCYRPSNLWKVYLSWNTSQRMPTFTDLYYKSPTQEGNVGLKPEKTNELSLSTEIRPKGVLFSARVFYRHDRDMIDWIMTDADAANDFTTYHATAFKIDKVGFHTETVLDFSTFFGGRRLIDNVHLGYTFITQKRYDDVQVVAATYALDYLKHKFVAALNGHLLGNLFYGLEYRFQKRMGHYMKYSDQGLMLHHYVPYGMLNLKMTWKQNKYELYVTADNLTGTHYYDIGNVPQPGCWIMAGVRWSL